MDGLIQDLRYAVRALLRRPGFAAIAVLTLGLGIGANSAIFSVVNGVLLRSLPFPDADRLVRVYTAYPQDAERYALSPPDFMSVRVQTGALETVAAYVSTRVTLTGAGDAAEVGAALVSDGFFSLLGAAPILGRAFLDEEHRPGAPPVVVLSHAVWQQRFGGDPGIVGGAVTLNGVPRTVVGVLPAGFDHPDGRAFYLPLHYDERYDAATDQGRRGEFLSVIARLRPGIGPEQAAAELRELGLRLQREFPQTNESLGLGMISVRDELVGEVRTPLLVLLGAVGLVLLIACANVANLLLVRSVTRSGEIAVRAALGAPRGRLVRQLLTESVVLGAAGGAAGLLLAYGGTRALLALRPEGIPRVEEISLDPAVLAFTAAVALLSGLLFGLFPAVQGTRSGLAGALRDGGRTETGGRAGLRTRNALVVAEIALAVMLLVGAGLLVRSFVQLTSVDPGFRADAAVTFDLRLTAASYPEDADVRGFYRRLFERLEALPGATAVAATSSLPLSGAGILLTFDIEGRAPVNVAGEEVEDLAVRIATADYFRAMGIAVRQGRAFDHRDRADGPPVVLLNETAVRRFLPGEDPLGRRVLLGWVRDEERVGGEVAGVAADVKQYGLDRDVRPEIYLLHDQVPFRALSVVVRTAGDPLALTGGIREAVQSLDPGLPVQSFRTLDDVVRGSVARPRFYTLLLTLFAGVALLLAAVGTFGVISYNVARRSRELGLRLALGARPGDVLGMVLRGSLGLAAVGLAAGIAASIALSRALGGLLYGVAPLDPVTYLTVAAVVGGAAALAAWLPARRAARLDPAMSLRAE